MKTELNNHIRHRFNTWVRDNSLGDAKSHAQVLAIRQAGLSRMAEIFADEVQSLSARNSGKANPVFDRDWLETFASGDVTKCLGQAFQIYKDRRCPRIPNGDFLLISRVMQVKGEPGTFDAPAHITAEFDVPDSTWIFDGAEDGRLPVSFLLEIALQPSGVLTAWLGTQLRFPEINYFFRNLDGDVKLRHNIPLRGKTVKASATLTRTIFSGTIIIQHFDFELAVNGAKILEGTSSFGYFPKEMMATQVGMNAGKPSRPWGDDPQNSRGAHQARPARTLFYPDCPTGKLKLIDEVKLSPGGGKHGRGYAMASRKNSPGDWFYANHFYQDPVMPGSLGIEAVLQAFKTLAHAKAHSDDRFILAEGTSFTWQYRGQVLPTHSRMRVDVHLKNHRAAGDGSILIADAGVWADDIRIYDIQNLALKQIEESKK
jgi:3-hydroxymyristoyl/3-hydroxydecanoyl-(acyl carrier protein) dehydratase